MSKTVMVQGRPVAVEQVFVAKTGNARVRAPGQVEACYHPIVMSPSGDILARCAEEADARNGLCKRHYNALDTIVRNREVLPGTEYTRADRWNVLVQMGFCKPSGRTRNSEATSQARGLLATATAPVLEEPKMAEEKAANRRAGKEASRPTVRVHADAAGVTVDALAENGAVPVA